MSVLRVLMSLDDKRTRLESIDFMRSVSEVDYFGESLDMMFVVELGAEIMVASTMLPSRNIKPFFSRCLFTSLNSTLPRPCCSRK